VLHHVALELDPADLPRAREFWRLLGYVEVEPPPSLAGRTVWLEPGPAPDIAASPTQIHLIPRDTPAAPPTPGPDPAAVERPSPAVERPAPAGHAAILVPGYAERLGELRRHEFEVRDRRPHWGAPRAFAAHPGGHTIELMAAPPM